MSRVYQGIENFIIRMNGRRSPRLKHILRHCYSDDEHGKGWVEESRFLTAGKRREPDDRSTTSGEWFQLNTDYKTTECLDSISPAFICMINNLLFIGTLLAWLPLTGIPP